MRVAVAPVSADLLIKLGIGIAAGLALWYVASKAAQGIRGAADSVAEVFPRVLDGVNPASSGNLVYRGLNAAGGAVMQQPGGFSYGADVRDAAEAGLGTTDSFVLDSILYPFNRLARELKK